MTDDDGKFDPENDLLKLTPVTCKSFDLTRSNLYCGTRHVIAVNDTGAYIWGESP